MHIYFQYKKHALPMDCEEFYTTHFWKTNLKFICTLYKLQHSLEQNASKNFVFFINYSSNIVKDCYIYLQLWVFKQSYIWGSGIFKIKINLYNFILKSFPVDWRLSLFGLSFIHIKVHLQWLVNMLKMCYFSIN